MAKVAPGKEQAMRLAQRTSGSQKPHTSGYIRDTGFGIAPDRISLWGRQGVPMLLRVTKVSAQFEMHVVLLAVERDLQSSLLPVREVPGDSLELVVVLGAGLDVNTQAMLSGKQPHGA